MDATFWPRQFFSYAEKKRIMEIFENMLERLIVDRPEKPIDFLYDLLMKHSVYDVPKVYVLGPPTVDRKLVCSALSSKLNLIHLTQHSLEQNSKEEILNDAKVSPEKSTSTWANLLKERVKMPDCLQQGWIMEAFPKTRLQAFAFRKAGVFPTHIAIIDDPVIAQRMTIRSSSGVPNTLNEEEMREIVEYSGQINSILDLHNRNYVKKFQVGKYDELEKFLTKVIEFVRSKQCPSIPFLPRVLLLGPNGSGRRTVAKKLAEKYKVIEVNYKEELRGAALKDSPLKDEFSVVMQTSKPVPDELLVKVASERLLKEDCTKNGWIMYNFPETRKQTELLVKSLEGIQVNRAVFLELDLKTCLGRVERRKGNSTSGKVQQLKQESSSESFSVNRLMQLSQDSVDSVKTEHELYSKNVEEIKDFLRCRLFEDIVTEVDGNCVVEEVFESVQEAILKSAELKLPDNDLTNK